MNCLSHLKIWFRPNGKLLIFLGATMNIRCYPLSGAKGCEKFYRPPISTLSSMYQVYDTTIITSDLFHVFD